MVSAWRLLAERPAFDRSVPLPAILRPLLLGAPKLIDTVILHDPVIPEGHNWLRVYEVAEGEHRRFLSWISDTHPALQRLYIPVSEGFPSESPRYAGHWRASVDESSELPWPEPEPGWRGRASFLARFDRVEALATRIAYRGTSMCRLCGQPNGHEGLRFTRWEWPTGFRHYIAAHAVRPSPEFVTFILDVP